jgi:predicted membrane channel-forming protein YqfA (hemolysin III family)
MNALKMAGIALIAAGILGFVYSSFSYTRETHEAKIWPIELSVKDKQTLDVPVWAGVAFYATDSRLHFGHLIWHLFVMAGTTCHYFAVLSYAAWFIP